MSKKTKKKKQNPLDCVKMETKQEALQQIADYVQNQKNEKRKEQDKYTHNCRLVFDYVQRRKIKEIEVYFDGSGDSGQVDDIRVKPDTQRDILKEIIPFSLLDDGSTWCEETKSWKSHPNKEGTLEELLEQIMYDNLSKNDCGGWEINEGSYGNLTFDVPRRKVSLDFNQRVVEVSHMEDEETF